MILKSLREILLVVPAFNYLNSVSSLLGSRRAPFRFPEIGFSKRPRSSNVTGISWTHFAKCCEALEREDRNVIGRINVESGHRRVIRKLSEIGVAHCDD